MTRSPPPGRAGGKGKRKTTGASGEKGHGPGKARKAKRRASAVPQPMHPRPLPVVADAGPDFLCVGAQKGGTRWLYDQLQLHPDFWMPPIKELHYFDRRAPSQASLNLRLRSQQDIARANRRQEELALRPLDQRDVDFLEAYVGMRWWWKDLDAYGRLFALKGERLSGDVTPDYSALGERMIARIMRRFPHTRVVFIARDPVERAWSHLTMHMRRGTVGRGLDPDAVVKLLGQRFVATRSYPSKIVARWRRHVPEEQFGLFLFDDLVADADALRGRVLAFLGADPGKESGTIPAAFNRKQELEKVPLTPEIRDRIARHFAAELKASGKAFGGAAEGWAGRYGL